MIDNNHPITMYLMKVVIGIAFMLCLDAWLNLSPFATILIYLAVAILTNHWVEWAYWQLVISWQLLISRFK